MTFPAAATRGVVFLAALFVAVSCLSAQDQFDKDAFLSRKKWYVSFTLALKGKGNALRVEGADHWKTTWDISREVSGTFELDDVHQNHPRNSVLAAGEKPQGRFISWDVSTGLSSVDYVIADRVEHQSQTGVETGAVTNVSCFTKFGGSSSTSFGRSKELLCDLKKMEFDFDLNNLQGWNRNANEKPFVLTGEYHDITPITKVKNDVIYEPEDFGIFGFLPEVELLRSQLRSRKLELQEGRIEINASAPVETLPNFPNHRGSIPGGPEKFNFGTTEGGRPLELSLHVILSPTPPSRAKLILKPEDSYRNGPETWRPRCSDSEETPGNHLDVDWRVEEEGGDPARPAKVRRIVFSLLNTSKEPGVCMNHPIHPQTPAGFDLKFQTAPSSAPYPVAPAGYEVAPDGQKLTLSEELVSSRRGTIAVDCFDAGATGVLVAEAELEDGRVLKAVIEETGKSQLMIPDHEPGESWIATGWRNKHASGKKDDADEEDLPKGDGQVGDGLTVWEEYRGFWIHGKWEGYSDPKTKDLFICNKIGGAVQAGLWMFASITGLQVHDQLAVEEFRTDRVVNFNVGKRPHLVDQHCLVVTEGGFGHEEGDVTDIAGSISRHIDRADFSGPPKNTLEVSLLPVMILGPSSSSDMKGKRDRFAMVDWTICHELGHGLGIRHHGDKGDNPHVWTSKLNADGALVNTIDGTEVIVKDEKTGNSMVPSDYLSGLTPGKPWPVWIGERHGQMSGDDACVMRYSNASMYRSVSDSNVLYFFREREKPGTLLCSNPAGTGVNMPTHEPQSRYGGCDTKRGDCVHKFVVSDHWDLKN